MRDWRVVEPRRGGDQPGIVVRPWQHGQVPSAKGAMRECSTPASGECTTSTKAHDQTAFEDACFDGPTRGRRSVRDALFSTATEDQHAGALPNWPSPRTHMAATGQEVQTRIENHSANTSVDVQLGSLLYGDEEKYFASAMALLPNIRIPTCVISWTDWYFGWDRLLWLGTVFPLFPRVSKWRYTCAAHRKHGLPSKNVALDILNERYSRGEISHGKFVGMKFDISRAA